MTRREDPGVAEIEAEMRAEMERLQADPKTAAALQALGEQQALRDPLPLPQTLIDDAVEAMEKRQARERVRTQPNAVAPALAGVRPVTRRLAVDVPAPQSARVEKVMVEGMRALPSARAHDETNVGGRVVATKADDAEDRASSAVVEEAVPVRRLWIVGLVIAAAAAAIALLVWAGGPSEKPPAPSATFSAVPRAVAPSTTAPASVPTGSAAPSAPATAASSGAVPAESSAPAAPTAPRPMNTGAIVAPVPSSPPSAPPTPSSSASPPASSGPAIIKIHG